MIEFPDISPICDEGGTFNTVGGQRTVNFVGRSSVEPAIRSVGSASIIPIRMHLSAVGSSTDGEIGEIVHTTCRVQGGRHVDATNSEIAGGEAVFVT